MARPDQATKYVWVVGHLYYLVAIIVVSPLGFIPWFFFPFVPWAACIRRLMTDERLGIELIECHDPKIDGETVWVGRELEEEGGVVGLAWRRCASGQTVTAQLLLRLLCSLLGRSS